MHTCFTYECCMFKIKSYRQAISKMNSELYQNNQIFLMLKGMCKLSSAGDYAKVSKRAHSIYI